MKRFFTLSLFSLFMFFLSHGAAFSAEPETDLVFAEKCDKEDVHECPYLTSSDESRVALPKNYVKGEQFSVLIVVHNGGQKNIVTVRSWLQYNAQELKALEIEDQQSDFPLASPDGNEIDAELGQVKIGRGVAGGGLNLENLVVAEVKFEVVASGTSLSEISFINFQKEVLGDTGVFILNTSTYQPENILEKGPKKLIVSLNGGTGSESDNTDDLPPNGDGSSTPPLDNAGGNDDALLNGLPRPEDLRIQANAEGVNLVWKMSDGDAVKGYYVYYSTTTGFYIHRKDAGKTNHFEFRDLTLNKVYYFSVTAYDANGRESDYSDEVFAKVGVPGTESHPYKFAENEKKPDDKATIPPYKTGTGDQLDKSGPAESIAVSFAVLGMFFILYSFFRMRLFSLFS